jgi:Ca-activated chloride channel homolog
MTYTPTSTLEVRQDRRLIRTTSHSRRYLLARVVAPNTPTARERSAVNLAIVLDRSGSMSGPKLDVAKAAVSEAIGRLQPQDRFSVVTYDDRIDIVIASTPASGEARRGALARLSTIEARGSTNLGEGWLRGCEQVAEHLTDGGIDRCLLLTDGLANAGITDPDELAGHAHALRARGISTSTFGVGNDFDERLLQHLADAGGGHFYYIADAPQIRDAISSEVGETLAVVARDVALEVTARADVRVEPLSPYPAQTVANRTSIALGDLISGQAVEVVLRVAFPYGQDEQETGAIVALTDRDGVFAAGGLAGIEPVRLGWVYASGLANDLQVRDDQVDRAVAEAFAARARQEAVRRNRDGDFGSARSALRGTAERIRSYAGTDAAMAGLVAELENEAMVMSAPMPEPMRKAAYFRSANVLHSRDATGRSRRTG